MTRLLCVRLLQSTSVFRISAHLIIWLKSGFFAYFKFTTRNDSLWMPYLLLSGRVVHRAIRWNVFHCNCIQLASINQKAAFFCKMFLDILTQASGKVAEKIQIDLKRQLAQCITSNALTTTIVISNEAEISQESDKNVTNLKRSSVLQRFFDFWIQFWLKPLRTLKLERPLWQFLFWLSF